MTLQQKILAYIEKDRAFSDSNERKFNYEMNYAKIAESLEVTTNEVRSAITNMKQLTITDSLSTVYTVNLDAD